MKLISNKGFNFFFSDNLVYFIDRDKDNLDIFFRTDLYNTTQISREEFINTKFDKASQTIESPYTECIKLGNDEYLTCIFYDSTIIRHDIDGNKVKEYSIGHFETGFDTTYSIAVDKNKNLWIAQPSSNYVGQFSLDTENELFKIGGNYKMPDAFDHPEQVRVFGDYILVCDMGHKRICKINTDTKELTEYKVFIEPIFEYGQFKSKEIVKLSSGLYIL